MSKFDEKSLARKISELSSTQQSIQTLSYYCIHYRRKAAIVVEYWYNEVLRQKDPRKLSNLLNLANDVLQNSRRKGSDYVDEFKTKLEKALIQMAVCGDDKSIRAMRRILGIWEDRGVYKRDFIETLLKSIRNYLHGSLLRIFNTKPAVTDLKSRKVRDAQATAAAAGQFSPSPMDDEPSTSKSGEPLSPGRSPPSPSREDEEELIFPSRLSPRDSPVEAPTTEELLSMIRRLEDAPSTDAVVRQDIAMLPSDVADVNKLDQIVSKRAAETLSEVVDRADVLLDAYNKRLADELDQRKLMLRNLDAYVSSQNERMTEDQKILEQWRTKLSKLGQDRKDLKAHVESLPDLKNLTKPLAPLPSLGELFTKS